MVGMLTGIDETASETDGSPENHREHAGCEHGAVVANHEQEHQQSSGPRMLALDAKDDTEVGDDTGDGQEAGDSKSHGTGDVSDDNGGDGNDEGGESAIVAGLKAGKLVIDEGGTNSEGAKAASKACREVGQRSLFVHFFCHVHELFYFVLCTPVYCIQAGGSSMEQFEAAQFFLELPSDLSESDNDYGDE